MLLDYQGLLTLVEGTHTRPDSTVDPDAAAEWDQRNKMVQYHIYFTLSFGASSIVKGLTIASAAWSAIINHFEGKGGQRKLQLLRDALYTPFIKLELLEP